MRVTWTKFRIFAAGAVAFLIGIPMTEKAFAQSGGDIFGASLDLAFAIAESAGDS